MMVTGVCKEGQPGALEFQSGRAEAGMTPMNSGAGGRDERASIATVSVYTSSFINVLCL
jgi:hypothetical protein